MTNLAVENAPVSARDVAPELIAHNPATGEEIGRVATTPPGSVADIVQRARDAQRVWARKPWRERRTRLDRFRSLLARDADAWADAIRLEIGKPHAEALGGDVIASLDAIRWTIRHGGSALTGERLGAGLQRLLQVGPARLRYEPLGVVGMIGTWNYPLFLNAPSIAQAVAAGNGVVWKPSELAPLAGVRLQQTIEEAGFPEGLVSAVFGGADVGRALVESRIDKGLFTGGVENGRRVLGALASRGVSAVAELSGFDAAIVLPDAPLEATVRDLSWAAFVGAGQTCVAVKRIYAVGKTPNWADAIARAAKKVRVGDPSGAAVDMGPLISEQARARFHAMVRSAVDQGAEILAGGEPAEGPGWFYPPTVLRATDARPERALAGAFGPVVLVRHVADDDAAVAETNASDFALAASVWSRDVRAARALALQLDAGLVSVNEAVTPVMHAGAPFGGHKASGFGRTHGTLGLREFTRPQVVSTRRAGGFRPHLYPYGRLPVEAVLRVYRRLFHAQA
jgi:acyl-CoA reductase-like NAD-dependent aldehyde dehydrogenase